MFIRKKTLALITAATLTLAGCGSDSDSSSNNNDQASSGTDLATYATLDAASDTSIAAYIDLSSGHNVTENDNWQFAYQKYVGFSVNGGISGSRTVEACVAHEYTALFDGEGKPVAAEFKKLNSSTTLANFNAVNKTACDDFEQDGVKTQITTGDWLDADYSGGGAPVFSAKAGISNGWILRSASKDQNDNYDYARIKVSNVEVQGASRNIKISSEAWDANSQSFSAAVESPVMSFSAENKIHWDMQSNTLVTAADDWEISVSVVGRDYPLQVNGGASGDGKAAIGLITLSEEATAADITDPTSTSQVYKYFTDTATGALSKPGSYGPFQYNISGSHQMWPTYTTYLFKDGEDFYKAQVISNYGEAGDKPSATIYVRYEAVID